MKDNTEKQHEPSQHYPLLCLHFLRSLALIWQRKKGNQAKQPSNRDLNWCPHLAGQQEASDPGKKSTPTVSMWMILHNDDNTHDLTGKGCSSRKTHPAVVAIVRSAPRLVHGRFAFPHEELLAYPRLFRSGTAQSPAWLVKRVWAANGNTNTKATPEHDNCKVGGNLT